MAIGRCIDVSSDQHPNNTPIDWMAVAGAGVTTVIVKATQGTTYVNPWLGQDVAGASAAGLDVRCYHFADFTNPAAEAAWFLQHAGAYARAGDFETSTNVAWMREFLQNLGAPADQLLAYGSASSLVSIYAQLPAMAWVAEYQALSPGWGVLWQFSETASIPGISGPVDEDKWQGSEMQYDVYFGVYDPVPPSPLPLPIKEDTMGICQGTDGKLYIEGASAGTANSAENNLLLFQVTPGQPFVVNNVIDLTNMLRTQGDGEWQVQ
jgi:lysozyme